MHLVAIEMDQAAAEMYLVGSEMGYVVVRMEQVLPELE